LPDVRSLQAVKRGEVFEQGVAALKGAGVENPALDAAVLLGYVTGAPTGAVLLDRQLHMSSGQRDLYHGLILKRCQRVPVSRLLGEREFFSRNFYITPDVLDPRPDTEILVEEAMKFLEEYTGRPYILDVGTGSGAIAVTLAAQMPGARIAATDISFRALKVARSNALRHGVLDRIDLIQTDLFSGIRGEGKFSMIVSNPPYVSCSQHERLDKEVREGDPEVALVAGPEGTEFYPRLLGQAGKMLSPGGSLMVEVGQGQDKAVAGMFCDAGLTDVCIIKDLGGIGRVVTGRTENA
jgi:release factor glutamine methyltransferase